MSATKSLRLIHDGHVKVYLGDLKQEHKFKFIYRDNYSNVTRVCCKDTFPLELVYTHSGYLFVKGKRNTIAKQLNKLPLLEDIYENDMRKTRYIDLSKYITKETSVVVKCCGFRSAPVKMLKEYVFNISTSPITKIDLLCESLVEEIEEHFKCLNISNIDEWIAYLEQNCPMNSSNKLVFGYPDHITNAMFKSNNKLVPEEIRDTLELQYDIRINKEITKHLCELDIVKAIEQYEDQDQYVIFYNNMNNRIKEVKAKLKEKGYEYEPVDIRKFIMKNPELRKKDSTDIAIKVKWNELNDLGIEWTLSDFV